MQVQPNGNPVNLTAQPVGSSTRATDASILPKAPIKAEQKDSTASEINKLDDPKAVQEAANRLQDFVSEVRGDIQFSLDSDSGRTVVKVIDRTTKEVIRQLPSQEALEIAKALDRFQGLLIKQQA